MDSSGNCQTRSDANARERDEGCRAVGGATASLFDSGPTCRDEARGSGGAGVPSFTTRWAVTTSEVASAQRLRFKVFGEELGACLSAQAPDRDVDEFDAPCQHLLVLAHGDDGDTELIATCRVLLPDGARRIGRFYSDGEFDLSALRDLLTGTAEMGRVCVAPAWRNGVIILALWRELGRLMVREGLDTLIGCSSVGAKDDAELAIQLWHSLRMTHLVEPQRRVRPWRPLALRKSDKSGPVEVPPLIKGYLRCGGRLLGPPAYDAAFNTADFPMMLRLSDLPSSYRKRFLGE